MNICSYIHSRKSSDRIYGFECISPGISFRPMNLANQASGRARRRAIALTLTLALGMSATEAVAGPVRDGAVHHESSVEASSHQFAVGIRHHHDGSPESMTGAPVDASHSDLTPSPAEAQHEHPGGDDHCAHVHGVALVPTLSLSFSVTFFDALLNPSEHHDDPLGTVIHHPPRP